jgi:hypothetical protein
MTKALVVYESVFGATRKIAEALASGLAEYIPTDVVAAAHAPAEIGPEIGLVVVGVPTHAFSMPTTTTREGAIKQYGATIEDTSAGVHEWLDRVSVAHAGIGAAALDTVVDHPKLVVKLNHATKVEEKLLHRHGLAVIAPPEHFVVTDARGPLAAGEEDRARAWGRTLASRAFTGVRS